MNTASTIQDSDGHQPSPEVFQKIQNGDHAAFGTLVRCYNSYAYALAMRFVWDPQEADDIVQDSFIKVWDNIGAYQPDRKFTTWLYAIVTRLSIDHIRKRNRWSKVMMREPDIAGYESPDDSPSPDEVIDTERTIDRIRLLVDRLPRIQRLVFTLRDLQDLPMEEIVEITGQSSTTVKANLWHARRRIKELMERSQWIPGS